MDHEVSSVLSVSERMALDGLDEYQRMAARTAVYNGRGGRDGFIYTAMGLAAEAGEAINNAKKVIRGDDDVARDGDTMWLGDIGHPETFTRWQMKASRHEALKAELGDILWYVAMLCDELGLDLSSVAADNVAKLRSLALAGTLKGDGNKR